MQLIKGNAAVQLVPKCSVQTDDTKETYTEFVAIGYNKKTGETVMHSFTDAVTLGKAMRMISKAFTKSYTALTEREKALVDSALK